MSLLPPVPTFTFTFTIEITASSAALSRANGGAFIERERGMSEAHQPDGAWLCFGRQKHRWSEPMESWSWGCVVKSCSRCGRVVRVEPKDARKFRQALRDNEEYIGAK